MAHTIQGFKMKDGIIAPETLEQLKKTGTLPLEVPKEAPIREPEKKVSEPEIKKKSEPEKPVINESKKKKKK